MELYNIQLEESVLGMLMNESTAFLDISFIINVNCFYDDHHKDIYLAIEKLSKENRTIDVISIFEILKKRNAGITAYQLSKLSNQVSGSNNFLISHCQQLYELYYKRELERLSHKIINSINNNDDIDDTTMLISKTIDNLDVKVNGQNDIENLAQNHVKIIEKRIENHYSNKDNFIKTGWKVIDNHLYFCPGDLVIFGGRPGMGKTSFSLALIKNVAFKYHVCIFNLEMTKEALLDRLILSELPEDFNHIDYKNGKLINSEYLQIEKAIEKIKKLKLYIYDIKDNIRTPLTQKRILYKLKKENKLDFVICDYLGLMDHNTDNANKELGRISMELKTIAMMLSIPCFLLHQLNRAVEMRKEKRPQLADLRDSGELEQNADIVLFILRPEYYMEPGTVLVDSEGNSLVGITEIIIAKNRDAGIPNCKILLKHSKNIKNYYCLDENNEDELPF